MIGWALRWVLSCCGVALLCTGFLKLGPEFFLDRATKSQPVAHPVEISSPVNTLVYPANEQGHVILDAAVNDAPMRLLVDTGASLVTLTPADAYAAANLGFLRVSADRPVCAHKRHHGRSWALLGDAVKDKGAGARAVLGLTLKAYCHDTIIGPGCRIPAPIGCPTFAANFHQGCVFWQGFAVDRHDAITRVEFKLGDRHDLFLALVWVIYHLQLHAPETREAPEFRLAPQPTAFGLRAIC